MRMTKAMTMIITWLSTHRPFQRNEEIERKKIIEGRRKYQSVAGRQAIWCPCMHLISSLYTVPGVWRVWHLPAEFQAQESLAHQRSSKGGDCAETAMGWLLWPGPYPIIHSGSGWLAGAGMSFCPWANKPSPSTVLCAAFTWPWRRGHLEQG